MSSLISMVNGLKLSLFASQRSLEDQRLFIAEEEVREFWENCSLFEMEEILTIQQEKVIERIWVYVSYYLQNKRSGSSKNAYCIKDKKTNENLDALMWFYDCKIFRSQLYTKEENEMVSSFIIRYKDKSTQVCSDLRDQQGIFEFINANLMETCSTILKCKESSLLKIYGLFKQIQLEPLNGDVVIIPENLYFQFLCSWLQFCHSWETEAMVKHLFRGVMVLMQNQIALSFFKTLTEADKQIRRYEKPVAVYEKPKLKETYTMVEEGIGDVHWYTLKIHAFKLKYKVQEDEKKYVCYRVKEPDSFDTSMHEQFEQLEPEDRKIIMAFDKIKATYYLYQF